MKNILDRLKYFEVMNLLIFLLLFWNNTGRCVRSRS